VSIDKRDILHVMREKKIITYKILSVLAILAAAQAAQAMSTAFFKPASMLPKIRFANDAFFTINSSYSRSFAKKSFNKHGEKSYLFDWNNPETLLNSFTNPALAATDTSASGKAYIDGRAITHEMGFAVTKNIPRGFFFDLQIYQRYLTLKKISLVPLDSKNEAYSSDAALAADNPALADYITAFTAAYPLFRSTSNQKYILHNSFLLAGYTKSWDDFEEIDFFDATCKAGFFIQLNNQTDTQILELPLINNNGFCAECNVAVGILNWINIGATVSTKWYISNQQTLGLNTHSIDNDFLKLTKGRATVKPQAFFYSNLYIEADHLIGGLSLLLGYSYAHQQKTIIQPIDDQQFPHHLNTEQSRFQKWSFGTFIFDIEYDFATEKNLNVPAIKFSLYQPIHGKRSFKSATEALSCCLQFSHKF
jgi:hypothetical protein